MMNKPSTNIQMLQQHVFLKNKSLIIFLKKHAINMYNDLVNKYATLMDKLYSSSTLKYCGELNRLLYDKQDRFSLISSEELNK